MSRNRKGKGLKKPIALTVLAMALIGTGYWTYTTYINPTIEIEGIDEATRSALEEVDLNSQTSIASALYNSILSDNYTGVAVLVDRFKTLEKQEHPELQYDLKKNDPIDITPFLTRPAIISLNEKVEFIIQRLTLKQDPSTYKLYLDMLVNIFSFFKPTDPSVLEAQQNIIAYLAFKNNQDYTISDIRSFFGPIKALYVCRYLMGSNDYSRISPTEMRDYITSEINTLIATIPVNVVATQRTYSTADFSSLSIPALKEIIDLNIALPTIITDIQMIEGIRKEELTTSYNSIKQNYFDTVQKGIRYLNTARIFYMCQALSSRSMDLQIKTISKAYKNATQIGKIPVNVYKVLLEEPIDACAGANEVYIAIPDRDAYKAILDRGINKMSDSERSSYEADLALIDKFVNLSRNLSIKAMSSDFAAVENHLERNPEQGYFVGEHESGLLFNLQLDSYDLITSLDINRNQTPAFTPSQKLVNKYKDARLKLGIIEDFTNVENRMSSLDFTRLEQTPYQYTRARLAEEKSVVYNYQDQNFLAQTKVEDDVHNIDLDDNNTTQNTIEIASAVLVEDYLNDDESTDVESDTSRETVAEDVIPSDQDEEEAQTAVEEPKVEPQPEPKVEPQPEPKVEPKPEPKVEPKPEPKVEPQPEPKVEPQPEPEPIPAQQIIAETEEPPAILSLAELKDADNKILEQQVRKMDNPDAMYALAVRYINGSNGLNRNIKAGTKLLEQAVAKKHLRSEFMLGSILLNTKNKAQRKKGADYIFHAANNELSEAYGTAGQFYLEGTYTKQNTTKGVELLTQAANNGDTKAQYVLGINYLRGTNGLTKAPAKAMNLLTAASKRNASAMYELAKIYEGDVFEEVKANQQKKEDLYLAAARGGCTDANKMAGLILLSRGNSSKEALKFLEPYANKGDKEIDSALFKYYLKINDTKNIAKFIIYADAATQAKFPLEMGLMYESGNGVKRDYKKAEEYYRKAIAEDKTEAYCHLGRLFLDGKGMKRDLRAAVGQFTRGAEAGELSCMGELATIKLTQHNYENFNEAFAMLNKIKANHNNDSYVNAMLGAMYIYGVGTPANEQQGLRLLNQSSNKLAKILIAIHGKQRSKLKEQMCREPVLAGALGILDNNRTYLAYAAFNDPFFIGELKNTGSSTLYDDMYLSAVKACSNVRLNLLHDANVRFRKPDEHTVVPEELYRLGMIYFSGHGVSKNFVKAFTFMQNASNAGYKKAFNNLGVFYLLGIGTTQNGKSAFESFNKGVAIGDSLASLNAGAVRKGGIGIKNDHNKAMDQLTSAASKGNRTAGLHLLLSYDQGIGNKQSNEHAFRAFATLLAYSKD